MSELTLNHNSRLTDALERDLLRGAMEGQRNVQAQAVLKHNAHAAGAFSSYVADVFDAMNRARAASSHYTGSQW